MGLMRLADAPIVGGDSPTMRKLHPNAKDGPVVLKIGSNDGFKCWFNGKEAGGFPTGRAYIPDQDSLKVDGRKGANTVLIKVAQEGGSAWAFSVRITDPAGKPVAFQDQPHIALR